MALFEASDELTREELAWELVEIFDDLEAEFARELGERREVTLSGGLGADQNLHRFPGTKPEGAAFGPCGGGRLA